MTDTEPTSPQIPDWERELLDKHAAEQEQVDRERVALLPWVEVTAIRMERNGRVIHVTNKGSGWVSLLELLDQMREIVRPGAGPHSGPIGTRHHPVPDDRIGDAP